jgi:hypothetical protein
VILGMRLSALPPAGQRLSHEGVEAIALLPVEKSNKDVVYQHMNTELIAFVAHESAKARPNERLLGSSEVIESILGKLKRLEQDQAKSGFTGLLLSIGAMVSTTTSEVVQKALETVSTKKVLAWCKETLGQSVQARRREAFASHDKSEQKRDQSWYVTTSYCFWGQGPQYERCPSHRTRSVWGNLRTRPLSPKHSGIATSDTRPNLSNGWSATSRTARAMMVITGPWMI